MRRNETRGKTFEEMRRGEMRENETRLKEIMLIENVRK